MRTIDKIITQVDCKFGAPMGRVSYDDRPKLMQINDKVFKDSSAKIFDCAVPMSGDGAYDKGGVYWGTGNQLRVKYTKDLLYVQFYRKGE